MKTKSVSNELLDIAMQIEQLKNSIFFMNNVLENVEKENQNYEKTKSDMVLNRLQNEVARVLPFFVSFTDNAAVETKQIANQLYVISDQIEDMEREHKKKASLEFAPQTKQI